MNITKNCNKTMKVILLLKPFYSQSYTSTIPEKTLYFREYIKVTLGANGLKG